MELALAPLEGSPLERAENELFLDKVGGEELPPRTRGEAEEEEEAEAEAGAEAEAEGGDITAPNAAMATSGWGTLMLESLALAGGSTLRVC